MRRSPWATSWLLLIPLLIGAALRFHQAWSYYGVYMPRADQEEGYYEAGIALSSYHVLSILPATTPTAFRAPIYPAFIAAVESPFGHPHPGHVRMAQAALSTLAIVAAYALARLLLSPLAGLLAATLLALDPDQIMAVSSLNVHGFYGFCVLGLAIAAVFWVERRSGASALVLGAALATSLLCRAAHFPFPVLLAAAYLFWWKFPERRWRKIGLLAAATVLFLSPMAIRNALQFRKFIPFDLKGSYILLRSTAGAYVDTTVEQSLDVAEALQPGFKKLGLSWQDQQAALVGLAVRNIAAHPLRYAWFCLQRFVLFWRGLWIFLLLALAALAGNYKNRGLQALAVVAASFSGYAVAGGIPAYRVSVVPVLDVLAGCGLATAAARWKSGASPSKPSRRWSLHALLGCCAVVYFSMVCFLSLEIRDRWWPAFRKFPGEDALYNDGRAAEVLGLAAISGRNGSIAAIVYMDALTADAAHWSALGETRKAELDLRSAKLLEATVRSGSTNAFDLDAASGLQSNGEPQTGDQYLLRSRRQVSLLMRAGRPAEALAAAGRLVAAATTPSDQAESRALRADIELGQGKYAEAEADLKTAVDLSPQSGELRIREAVALSRAGKRSAALGVLDDAGAALSEAPGVTRARWLAARGFVKMSVNDEAGARTDLAQALEADARAACLGSSDLEDRRRLPAFYFDACVARFPADASLRLDRGVARFVSKGDAPGAQADFREALKIRPDSLEAALSLAALLEQSKRGAEALAILDGALAKAWAMKKDPAYAAASTMANRLRRTRAAAP